MELHDIRQGGVCSGRSPPLLGGADQEGGGVGDGVGGVDIEALLLHGRAGRGMPGKDILGLLLGLKARVRGGLDACRKLARRGLTLGVLKVVQCAGHGRLQNLGGRRDGGALRGVGSDGRSGKVGLQGGDLGVCSIEELKVGRS